MKSKENSYKISVCNIGYIGVGKYRSRIDKKLTEEYNKWSKMISRCYTNKRCNKNNTYEDIVVCEEWHNFQNFATWFEENYSIQVMKTFRRVIIGMILFGV